MATPVGFGMHGFDPLAWCAMLAGTLDAVLEDLSDTSLLIARNTLDEYEAAIKRASEARERADNVIPLRPFSLQSAINDVLRTPGGRES